MEIKIMAIKNQKLNLAYIFLNDNNKKDWHNILLNNTNNFRYMLVLKQLASLWKHEILKQSLWRTYKTQASNKTKEYEGRKLVG
jgi:hypothetical protein